MRNTTNLHFINSVYELAAGVEVEEVEVLICICPEQIFVTIHHIRLWLTGLEVF